MPSHRVSRREYLIASITWASTRHKYFKKLLANYELELEGVTKTFNAKILDLHSKRSEHFKRTEEADPDQYSQFWCLEMYYDVCQKLPAGIDDSFLVPIKEIDAEIKRLGAEVNDLTLNLGDSISDLKKKILFMEELVLGGEHSAEMEGIKLDLAGVRDGGSAGGVPAGGEHLDI